MEIDFIPNDIIYTNDEDIGFKQITLIISSVNGEYMCLFFTNYDFKSTIESYPADSFKLMRNHETLIRKGKLIKNHA